MAEIKRQYYDQKVETEYVLHDRSEVLFAA